MNKTDFNEKLDEFYNGEIPQYIISAGRTFITIKCQDVLDNSLNNKITVAEIIRYYFKDARNISSGCRTLGSLTGDWRGVDNLAKECLEWFKFVNRDGLAKEGKKYGMELRG
jgi:hypothetical protein